jgi:hypothetical protein
MLLIAAIKCFKSPIDALHSVIASGAIFAT